MRSINPRWTAKYPFDPISKEYLKSIAFDVSEYFSEDLIHIVEYAYDRALSIKVKRAPIWDNDEIEAISYFLAVLIIRGTENRYIYWMFADSESKRANKLLSSEDNSAVVGLVKRLGLDVNEVDDRFGIYFLDYIKIASRFSSPSWKAYYYKVNNGYVIIGKRKLVRIVEEIVKERVLDDIERIAGVPQQIMEYSMRLIDDVKDVLEKISKSQEMKDVIQTKNSKVYPPCIRWMISNIGVGLPHAARFALVTFLSKMGYSLDEIINLFSRVPDFNVERTRYQVEHILGMRGGRKKYSVPSCRTLRSYNLCFPDDICKRLRHPVQYVYRARRGASDKA